MNCKFNEKYELGELDEEVYLKHTANCSVCQSILEKDKQLMELSGKLRQPIHAPNLWKNIERNIRQERERSHNHPTGVAPHQRRDDTVLSGHPFGRRDRCDAELRFRRI